MKIKDALKQIEAIEAEIPEYPYEVWTVLFGRKDKMSVYGNQISISGETDYSSVSKVKAALEWMVDQFGGTIKWGKNDIK